jgi:hypothetical protein
MKIDEVENAEDFWTVLLEDAIAKGQKIISIPACDMSEIVAIELAMKLDISVMVKGTDYIFSTTKEGTQALLGDHVTH